MMSKDSVVKELIQGQDFATQLQILFKKPQGDDAFFTLQHQLVLHILTSFTQALSLLSAEVCEMNLAPTSQVDSVGCDDRRSEASGESRKRANCKDGRGSHKRKKSSESWATVSASIEDGRAWRKYGQKQILNAKYMRSYFRCTHKYDRGCKATKQVQKMEQDPQVYCTTYIGHHTCRDDLILDNNLSESIVVRQECNEEETSTHITDSMMVWKDFVAFESPTCFSLPHSTEDTCQSFNIATSVDFDSDFHFDEIELFANEDI
ncbi:WRKY DNA-binding transcription factor 70 [Mercurialis annua]|uniref:WRKY DNA-binding transcription factor 70 n=1 Tax=Mercurialis annua TaxID=3986 RepID=UPI0024AE88AD|nr:WRKY DNA-binding transcription factor 70 [Mercurialis annua]